MGASIAFLVFCGVEGDKPTRDAERPAGVPTLERGNEV